MKKIYVLCISALLLLFSNKVYAQNQEPDIKSETFTLTDENRYQPIYYQEPEERYAKSSADMGRARASQGLSLEEYVVNALENFQTTIDVSAYEIPVEEAGDIYLQIINNNPGLFYVKSEARYSYSGNSVIEYMVSYRDTEDTIKEQIVRFDQTVDEVIEQVDDSMSDLEKALVVHDHIILNCEYDYERLQNNVLPDISHSAYGALVEQFAVCDGYASAFSYILKEKLGIKCDIVSSDSMKHAWNLISIDGKWYHVDLTWDDPVWDCIGQVYHSYFLISDTAVSGTRGNSNQKHEGWISQYSASSSIYDDAFWTNVTSGFSVYQSKWLYARRMEDKRTCLVEKDNLLDSQENVLYAVDTSWGYQRGYMFLKQACGKIYFNTRDSICRFDGTDVSVVYKPQLSGENLIFGFTIRGDQLCYALQSSPDLTSKQEVQTYNLPELNLPELEGIGAVDVIGVYNGERKEIHLIGIEPGDRISYAIADGIYGEAQPEMIDAGSYQVQYRVEREGYKTFYGKANVTIVQAEPDYTIPTGLQGASGTTLSELELPPGFHWENPSILLRQEGTQTYQVKYTPEDAKNYKEVFGINVEVTVKCPEHQYTTEVTKEPTYTEKGERTWTCTVCGDTYTKEIEVLMPVIDNISAADVKEAYDGTSKRIQINGTESSDVISYALGDGAYTSEQPEMINAGNYQMKYRVERKGYRDFNGEVSVVIEKAVPKYQLPERLDGSSGSTLGDVELPDNFYWESDPGERLIREGIYTYKVRYVPEDTKNYEEITDIAVKVSVTCPNHQYVSEIVKEPTETEKGEELYTCTICGNTYTVEIDSNTPAIGGVSAKTIRTVYDGSTVRIQVEGTEPDDVISYALGDGAYTSEQPEMINAGRYQVSYKVDRSGFRSFYGRTEVMIEQAEPSYDAPETLEGSIGQRLADLELPEGFQWESDLSTELSEVGIDTYYVKYVPDDPNYKEIGRILVKVIVNCPGHSYESEVTLEPTETNKGEKIYTCIYCGDIYTEEIDVRTPRKPKAVSSLKVTGTSVNTLRFAWNKDSGVLYRLVFYKGNSKVSTKYIGSSSCTYNRLQAATVYTLQVTPYREVNGSKVYASDTKAVKTATSPVRTVLSSVKKKGSSKGKISWKKTAGASGYEIYMKTDKGSFKKIKTITGGGKVSYTQKGLKKGRTYSFRVRAYKSVGSSKIYGAFSKSKNLKMKK